MELSVVVGCEGLLGKQIVAAKLSKPENIVIGYDSKKASNLTHDRFHFVSGSVESRDDIAVLRLKIKELQSRYSFGNSLNSIINAFAAKEYRYEMTKLPNAIPESGWMLWGWQNYPDSDFLRQYDVNLVGIHRILTTLYDCYQNSKSCSIINFSSTFARRNLDQQIFTSLDNFTYKAPGYGASKAAIENYTEYLSQVFKNSGIRVNAIAPGIVDTGQAMAFKEKYSNETNTGRLMDASEIVGAIEFLSSKDSSYMNGTCLTLDGGWSTR
jgi:NAD(P)-dependent dehydrogenase (short-subunit alcohol dehydrogenase family)